MCLTTHFDFESQPAKEQNLSFSDSSWEFDLKGVFFNPTASPISRTEGGYPCSRIH